MRGMRSLFVVLVGFVLLAGSALGQVKSSAITGAVTDPSGALVPNADVVVVNQQTNIQVAVKTNTAGEYAVPYLESGQYSVTVKAQGFRTFRKTDIVMGSGTTLRVDVALVTGSLETTIEVKADAIALQTESATVQGAVDQNIIQNIPNINNNPLYYATLQAGVVPTVSMYNPNVLGVGYADRIQMSAMRINGAPVGTNDVQLDGISVQGAAWHEATVMPNRDAIQEVRVVSNTFAADQGYGQGLIQMTSKTGTNQLHGSANYRLRNEDLNANGMYNNMMGIPRSKYRLNEYGGTVGGPVIIPKLFHGKDKLFFFASYERLNHQDPVNYLGNVPTDAQRQGDFSQTLVRDYNGNPIHVNIYDPFSAAPYQGSSQVFIRQPYPNAVITNPDPFGVKMLQAYPEPNHTPIDAFNDNNYSFSGEQPTTRNNLTTRLDYRVNDRQSIYLSGGVQNGSVTGTNVWGNSPFYNGGANESDDNPYAAIGDTITLNPTTVVDVRYGVARTNAAYGFPSPSGSFDYSAYGLPASLQSLVAIPGAALNIGSWNTYGMSPTNSAGLGDLNNDGWLRKNEHQTNHDLAGSVTKILGKWTLKAGGEYRVYLGDWVDLTHATPAIGIWQANAPSSEFGNIGGGNINSAPYVTSNAQMGMDIATPLIGAAGWDLSPGANAAPALASKYGALFTQNDWKVNDKLTVNLGLRWEVQPGPTERYNRESSVDLTAVSPYAQGLSIPGSPLASLGSMVFEGVGTSRNLWNAQWNNFSPRLGVAYRLNNALVLRGGYGRTFAPSNTGFNANGLYYGTAPYAPGSAGIPFGVTNQNGVPVGQFQDLQNTRYIPAPGAAQSPVLYGDVNGALSVDLATKNGTFKNGQVDQWNFFLEHSFGKNWLVSAGYVGMHGANLPWRGYQLNGMWTIPESTLQGWRNQWVASNGTFNPAQVQVPNPIPALIGQASGASGNGTLPAWEVGQPYQGLLGQTIMAQVGTVNYNALQLKLQHAYANGLEMMLNYTWSKALGIGGGPGNSTYAESQVGSGVANTETAQGGSDYSNLQNNYGLMSYDIPQRIVGVLTYNLPTGKGQKLDPGTPLLRGLVGGWQIGTVVTLQSGQPWGNNCGTMNGRCDVAPGEPLEVPTALQHWYNGSTSVTLPDGRTITPAANTFLKWNPDYWTVPMVQFPNGSWATDQYTSGTTSAYMGQLRTPGLANVNLTINRKFHLKERAELQFLAEATNAFNRTNFNPNAVQGGFSAVTTPDPSTNLKVGENASIGAGSFQPNFLAPRQITLSLRLQF